MGTQHDQILVERFDMAHEPHAIYDIYFDALAFFTRRVEHFVLGLLNLVRY